MNLSFYISINSHVILYKSYHQLGPPCSSVKSMAGLNTFQGTSHLSHSLTLTFSYQFISYSRQKSGLYLLGQSEETTLQGKLQISCHLDPWRNQVILTSSTASSISLDTFISSNNSVCGSFWGSILLWKKKRLV